VSSESSSAAARVPRGLKSELRQIAPPKLWLLLREVRSNARLIKYRAVGRPAYAGETAKARARRLREGFFEKYCVGRGLDIGYGGDLLSDNCFGWDLEHGDAQLLDRIEDESFDFVYSSHTLEHVADASAALRNWYRVVKPGGHLILFLPDRDLYEKKLTLPSRWNLDHKRFFLLDRDQPPATAGLLQLIDKVIPEANVVCARRCAEGHSIADPLMHSDGEYSIEVIVRKPLS
jgi:SAM-dependent methyltransferase